MADDHLGTYLNDHLAGAVVALELLESLEARSEEGAKSFFAGLRSEIAADRRELESLMERLRVRQSAPRKAVAWLSQKFAAIKLLLDDPSAGPLWRLEALEALSLGIEGKLCLWRSLAVASTMPELAGIDYDRLAERAVDQRARVEVVRLEAARVALTADRS
jgi:hypothetical protein